MFIQSQPASDIQTKPELSPINWLWKSPLSHLVDKIDKLENLDQIFRKYRHDRIDELLATIKKEVLFEEESPIDHVSLACELEDGSIICMKCWSKIGCKM